MPNKWLWFQVKCLGHIFIPHRSGFDPLIKNNELLAHTRRDVRGCEGHPLSDCRLVHPLRVGVPVNSPVAQASAIGIERSLI